ncbi:uroporphyrinogen-III synthase [Metallosphaera tengchongensis]|uniref:Uroporphyrinogen-III synthase n=1 Tax=Metallosphaera tengchongensis TaxID=1532350 RepID=A0A6N0NVU6_9CREN|nr:uroporphyrinogen-III synthase [Metallosphaera tengchongensis]QKQ99972.1 uroporphyrinogen-III synthase [Metallosphaera tengchongensis]
MRVLYLRPEGSEEPSLKGIEIINVPLFNVTCIPYDSSLLKGEGIAFTSVNAVRCFKDIGILKFKRIFSIGPSTAKELERIGISSEVPERYTSRDLATLILQSKVRSLTSVRSLRASQEMKHILSSISYTEIYDYDLTENHENMEYAKDLLEDCSVDIVVLTSSLIATTVAKFIKDCHKVITIGPMTSASLKLIRPDLRFIESPVSTIEGTLNLIQELKGGE